MTEADWGKLVVAILAIGFGFAVWRIGRGGGRVTGKVKGPAGMAVELEADRAPSPEIVLDGVRAGRDVTAGMDAGGGVHLKDVVAGRDVRASVKADDEDSFG